MATWDSKGIIVFPAVESIPPLMAELKLLDEGKLFELIAHSRLHLKSYAREGMKFTLAILQIDCRGMPSLDWQRTDISQVLNKAQKYAATYCVYYQNIADGDDSEIACRKRTKLEDGQLKEAWDALNKELSLGTVETLYLDYLEDAMYEIICDTFLSMEVFYDEHMVGSEEIETQDVMNLLTN